MSSFKNTLDHVMGVPVGIFIGSISEASIQADKNIERLGGYKKASRLRLPVVLISAMYGSVKGAIKGGIKGGLHGASHLLEKKK